MANRFFRHLGVALIALALLGGCATSQTAPGARVPGTGSAAGMVITSPEDVRMTPFETISIAQTRAIERVGVTIFMIDIPQKLFMDEGAVSLWGGAKVPRRTWYGGVWTSRGYVPAQAYLLDPGSPRAYLIVDTSGVPAGSRAVLFSTGGVFVTNLRGETQALPTPMTTVLAMASALSAPISDGETKAFLTSLQTSFTGYQWSRSGLTYLYPNNLGVTPNETEAVIKAAQGTNPGYTALGRLERGLRIVIAPDPTGGVVLGVANLLGAVQEATNLHPFRVPFGGPFRDPPFYGGR